MRRILIGLLGLVCVAGLMAALSGLLAPQARASPLADIRNQRVPLAGHTILVEAKMYMAASVGRWGYHYQVDLLHPPSGASALIFLVPSGADDRYVTASSGLWAAPRASPPLPQHPSFTATLHNLPVVGRLFAVAVPVGMAGLRRWRLTFVSRRGPVCGLFVISRPNPGNLPPRPTTYCNEAVIVDAY
jgi:hypothetical protein